MMWMDESGRRKPVDGSRRTLLKLHPDIRLNRLANWTCLLAVAPIYVHSLLQLVHLHYWNGLSSGLDRVVETVKGGIGEQYRRIMNNVENKHVCRHRSWLAGGVLGVLWNARLSLPPLSSCDCMCSSCQWMLMLWILSLGALSNTHAIGHKHTHTITHTHTCFSPATHPQAALGTELWHQYPSCVFCRCHSWDTLLGGCSLCLIGRCSDFPFFFWVPDIVAFDKSRLSSSGSTGSGGGIQFEFIICCGGCFYYCQM